jgi:hypothetical protein
MVLTRLISKPGQCINRSNPRTLKEFASVTRRWMFLLFDRSIGGDDELFQSSDDLTVPGTQGVALGWKLQTPSALNQLLLFLFSSNSLPR